MIGQLGLDRLAIPGTGPPAGPAAAAAYDPGQEGGEEHGADGGDDRPRPDAPFEGTGTGPDPDRTTDDHHREEQLKNGGQRQPPGRTDHGLGRRGQGALNRPTDLPAELLVTERFPQTSPEDAPSPE